MPEGPEVFALCLALNRLGLDAECYGKHLFHNRLDYSFGLNGRVHFDPDTQTLSKVASGYIPGDCRPMASLQLIQLEHNKAPDWIEATRSEFEPLMRDLFRSRKTIASALLDQRSVAGIGVAWGSEILHAAGIDPGSRSKDIDPVRFMDALIETRDRIREQYSRFVDSLPESELPRFVNEWFRNLYEIREMRVYKKGTLVVFSGRNWWISTDRMTLQ